MLAGSTLERRDERTDGSTAFERAGSNFNTSASGCRVLNPTFEGSNRFQWRPAGAEDTQELDVLGLVALQLLDGGLETRIGILVNRETGPFRAIVDGAAGRAEILDRRFVNTDAAAVVILDDVTMSEIGAGLLPPFTALRSNRLRFTGSYAELLAALTILSCSSEAIPAPCEGAI